MLTSIFSIIHSITTTHPEFSDKVTIVTQNYAQFKLSDGRVLRLRRERYKRSMVHWFLETPTTKSYVQVLTNYERLEK